MPRVPKPPQKPGAFFDEKGNCFTPKSRAKAWREYERKLREYEYELKHPKPKKTWRDWRFSG